MKDRLSMIGIQIPTILLPHPGVDLTRWAVIACDQFTSEPEYWKQVEAIVGEAPSTLNLVYPEVYLEEAGSERRIESIHRAMRAHLQEELFSPHQGLVYVERKVAGKTRHGLMLCLDLEQYDFSKGSSSLIRASEGTILERLPPRMKIRAGAPLELPHILVLIDDPLRTVIEPLTKAAGSMKKLYDFELMLDSGHLAGYAVDAVRQEVVIAKLLGLSDPEHFHYKYGLSNSEPVLLYAMGDGNHSLATAKAVWEEMKSQVGADHPARYALVEIENVHDEGLDFQPIHRVLFGVKKDLPGALKAYFGNDLSIEPCSSSAEMTRAVDEARGTQQCIGLVEAEGGGSLIKIANAKSNLPVGTLQGFLDAFLQEGSAEKIDYVHGSETVCRLGAQRGNAGFYLPGMKKSDLFKTVILDGALPRKTFSMGEAREKRFYMEARKITA